MKLLTQRPLGLGDGGGSDPNFGERLRALSYAVARSLAALSDD